MAKQNNHPANAGLTGFTLIELMVVIAIIGILATTITVSMNTARFKARDTRRVMDVRQLQLALQFYYDSRGSYPANLTELTPNFLSVPPKDPDGTSDYQYCVSSTKGYHLGTKPEGLELVDETALIVDVDIGTPSAPDGCLQGSFSGEDPVYDVTP